jgi:hypothetical protein
VCEGTRLEDPLRNFPEILGPTGCICHTRTSGNVYKAFRATGVS